MTDPAALVLDWGGVCERADGVDPEAAVVVAEARAAGMVVVVLSNELDPGRILTEPALAAADHVISLAGAAIAKPDRRAFLRAARAAGVEPEHLVVVDDDEWNLAGATAAGAHTVRFDPADPATGWAMVRAALGRTPGGAG